MGELEEKLESVMNNPEMMQKIMALAQSMGSSQQQEPPKQEQPKQEPQKQDSAGFPDIDLGMIQKLSGFAKNSGIDQNQKNLLNALIPYISQRRVSKLERAMRAAKMAGLATNLIGR